MQTDSPSSTPTQPAPKTVAGGGAGLDHYRTVGRAVWCGVHLCREFASEGTALDVADLLNRAYWNGHEAAAREVTA